MSSRSGTFRHTADRWVLETLEDDRGDAVTRSEPDGFAREIGHAEIHGLAMTGIIAGSSENQALANAAVSQLNGRRNIAGNAISSSHCTKTEAMGSRVTSDDACSEESRKVFAVRS